MRCGSPWATMIAKDLTDLMLIEWAMREQGGCV
jgi:hypothetical protein